MNPRVAPGRIGRPFITILRYNRPYWAAYLAGSVLAAAVSLVNLAMPMVLGHVVDLFGAKALTRADLALYCAALIGLGVVTGIARYFQRTLIVRA
ncbi:MAG: hypothetical protein FJY92_06560, partial [Candidatus Hydrogenedentes bacterium]|nr:hypothetical protein [Candidatus Hydrogenedentota bacterium]